MFFRRRWRAISRIAEGRRPPESPPPLVVVPASPPLELAPPPLHLSPQGHPWMPVAIHFALAPEFVVGTGIRAANPQRLGRRGREYSQAVAGRKKEVGGRASSVGGESGSAALDGVGDGLSWSWLGAGRWCCPPRLFRWSCLRGGLSLGRWPRGGVRDGRDPG